MASVELTNEQVVELVRQLPAEAKREVLVALAGEATARPGERMALAAEHLGARFTGLPPYRPVVYDGYSNAENHLVRR